MRASNFHSGKFPASFYLNMLLRFTLDIAFEKRYTAQSSPPLLTTFEKVDLSTKKKVNA